MQYTIGPSFRIYSSRVQAAYFSLKKMSVRTKHLQIFLKIFTHAIFYFYLFAIRFAYTHNTTKPLLFFVRFFPPLSIMNTPLLWKKIWLSSFLCVQLKSFMLLIFSCCCFITKTEKCV